MKPTQMSLPVEVRPEEVMRKTSLGSALELCAELGGYTLDKTLQQEMEVDKGQFSRWQSETEGIKWSKFIRLMDLCGNDAPLMWMVNARGYDLFSLRRKETETERENRMLREENAALRRVLQGNVV